MPIPEDLLVYGRADLLVPVAHQQPDAGAVPAFVANPRAVTRGVVFHYAHGWWYRGWRLEGASWLGTAFNIDLDGALFQCQEMATRTLHAGGGPLFNNGFTFVNDTAVGVEVCRFGAFLQQGAEYRASGYTIRFVPAAEPASGECDYSPGFHPAGGTQRFSLRKMRGGILVNTPHDANRHWYYAKLHAFGARRRFSTASSRC